MDKPERQLSENSSVMPGRHGGTLKRGGQSGGAKPGAGRPSKAYKIRMAEVLKSAKHQEAFKRAIENEDHPAFIAATRHAAAYAEGMPQQQVDVTSGGQPLTIRLVRE